MWIHGIWDAMTGQNKSAWKEGKIRGEVVLVRKNVLDLNDFSASFFDGFHELLGQHISFQLVSATDRDPNTGKGKVGKPAFLEEWVTTVTSLTAGDAKFKVAFEWDDKEGIPGAVIVRNKHSSEFFLKTLTIDGVPGKGRINFVCNSWVYPVSKYKYDRIFFANDTYLPSKMPEPLKPYRHEELVHLRGDDNNGTYELHERIYRYDVYNDLGNPDHSPELVRPILGGSEHPYPRRGRTGRHSTKTDPKSESRLSQLDLDIYVPRDERFGHLKFSDFLSFSLKAIAQAVIPTIRTFIDTTPKEFDSFQDILSLYEGGLHLPESQALKEFGDRIPFEFIKQLAHSEGKYLLKLPLPHVIREDQDKTAWRTDEEFGREMLAGVNPVLIRRVQQFPLVSKLDKNAYGDQDSKITADDLEKNLDGLKVAEAVKTNRLYILDHHDDFMPYLNKINALKGNYIYASRTVLFLKPDGTLMPVAIELSLPDPKGEQYGAVSEVYTPAAGPGVEDSIWQLAKAYVAVTDSGYHQLISHWLNTHAVIEPFIIATNRQLGIVHPIHKLLSPHYRDTMNINALARGTLINAGGIFESTVFPAKYALQMSSDVYRSWKLLDNALPTDLLKRGMAVPDPASPYKIKLLIKDYPYAVDGLAIWSAIETWVSDYVAIYYPNDGVLQNDVELQAWWKEIREVGHGDLKDEKWWPGMQTVSDLVQVCTTVIWIASALHAAVNFGQYPYAGYLPNRPTVSRQPMPKPGTEEYDLLKTDPDKVFIRTITSQYQTILGISLIEILSRHSSDEVYLGQRDTPEWTSEKKALEAFEKFGTKLKEIESRILKMNQDPTMKNRNGPVKMPYMLLYPNTSDVNGAATGLTAKGVPNSISI